MADLSGKVRHASASRADLPAVGDWVLAADRPNEGRATIQRVLARRSRFSRKGAGRETTEQIVAANVDTVFLVTSLNRDFSLRRLERYLTLAWDSGAQPIIVLNKADLADDVETWTREAESVAMSVTILVTSAIRGDGLDAVRAAVREGGTSALLGSSGVGKSTLVNALLGVDRQRVLEIREDDDRGRHATTSRQLALVPGGGVLIDTPGMRELQLWDSGAGLEQAFADIEALAAECRFGDCRHDSEPACAVRAAIARGDLGADRLESYRKLQREERFVESKQDAAVRAERTKVWKRIHKAQRQLYARREREGR